MTAQYAPVICYLCALPIADEPSRDHVPPQQFFAPALRQAFNLDRMVTLPTHKACNTAFMRDEEYVAFTVSTPAIDSPTAAALFDYNMSKYHAGRSQGLGRSFARALTPRPSGLILPGGKGVLRVDGARLKRVIWKIIRGLYFLEYDTPLPEATTYCVDVREPDGDGRSELDNLWDAVRSQQSRGEYQRVFAHKYLRHADEHAALHVWAMLWWDRIIVYCAHYDPDDPDDPRRAVIIPPSG